MLIDVSSARAFLTNPNSTWKHVDEIRGVKQGLSKLKMPITCSETKIVSKGNTVSILQRALGKPCIPRKLYAAIFCNLQICHLLQLAFNGALTILLPVQLHTKRFAGQ